uniref:Putative ovule protein n=1 Tax=Solanum chacoense TaxID=4108 RepID=A0A0V0GM23_SOLCH
MKIVKNIKNNDLNLCGCWDSSPVLHGHNVEFSPLNYSHNDEPYCTVNYITQQSWECSSDHRTYVKNIPISK